MREIGSVQKYGVGQVFAPEDPILNQKEGFTKLLETFTWAIDKGPAWDFAIQKIQASDLSLTKYTYVADEHLPVKYAGSFGLVDYNDNNNSVVHDFKLAP